jgi:hypothetical protein
MESSGLAGAKHLMNIMVTSSRSDFFDEVIHNTIGDFICDKNFKIENLCSIKETLMMGYDNIVKRYTRFYLLTDNPVFIWLCMADLREYTLAFDRYYHNSFPELCGKPFLKPLPEWITAYLAESAVGIEILVSKISRPITGRSKIRASEVRPGEHLRDVPKIFGFTRYSVNNLQKAREEILNMTIVFMAYRKGLSKTKTAELLYRFRHPDKHIAGPSYSSASGVTRTSQDMRVVNRERRLLGIDQ